MFLRNESSRKLFPSLLLLVDDDDSLSLCEYANALAVIVAQTSTRIYIYIHARLRIACTFIRTAPFRSDVVRRFRETFLLFSSAASFRLRATSARVHVTRERRRGYSLRVRARSDLARDILDVFTVAVARFAPRRVASRAIDRTVAVSSVESHKAPLVYCNDDHGLTITSSRCRRNLIKPRARSVRARHNTNYHLSDNTAASAASSDLE